MLKGYFDQVTKRPNYGTTVQDYLDLKVHADGDYPTEIIEAVRPHEPTYVKDYRKKIFAAITQPQINKVLTSLQKGRKSADWMVKFDDSKVPTIIRDGEKPSQYFETGLPVFGSLTNWLFSAFLQQMCIDAHAVCLVMPKQWGSAENEYLKPVPILFNSPQVIEYREGDYAVLLSEEKATNNGNIYYVVTLTEVQRWEQDVSKGKYTLTATYIHDTGSLPCWEVRGTAMRSTENYNRWRAMLYPMVPFLKEAIREYQDLQAGVVLHLYLERWEYESQDCHQCSGTGKVIKEGKSVKCPNKDCTGGKIASSPYLKKVLRAPRAGEPAPPNPPAGYIEKDVKIIEIQDQRVDKHLYKAAAAVNMQHVDRIPLAESGVAKSYDREETHNFAHSVFELLVWNADMVTYHVTEQRYRVVVPDPAKRKEMLPVIPVPEKYDLFTSAMLVEELKALPTSTSAAIMKHKQLEYATKTFGYDPDVVSEITMVMELDPLPGLTTDEKSALKQNGGITETDFIISSNISSFVARAIEETEGFVELPRKDQMVILSGYAEELKKQMEPVIAVPSVEEENEDEE